MNINSGLKIQDYFDIACKDLDDLSADANTIKSEIEGLIDNTVKGGIPAAIAGGVASMTILAIYYIYVCNVNTLSILLSAVFGILALILLGLIFYSKYINRRYYLAMKDYRRRIEDIIYNLGVAKNKKYEELTRYSNNVNNQLQVSRMSFSREMRDIESGYRTVHQVNNGTVDQAKNVLFFIVGELVALLGAIKFYSIFSQRGSDFGETGTLVISAISIILTVVLQYIAAKFVWGYTGCKVGYLTLLAFLVGPILFIVLAFLINLLVNIILFVLEVIAAIVIIAIALSCFSGG